MRNKKFGTILAGMSVVLFGYAFSNGLEGPHESDDKEKQVLKVISVYFDSLKKANEEDLKKVLAEEIVIGTTEDNDVLGRDEYVSNLKKISKDLVKVETYEIDVSIQDEQASVEFVLEMRWASSDDIPAVHFRRYVVRLFREAGSWRISSILILPAGTF